MKVIVLLIFFLALVPRVAAQEEMSSPLYKLQIEELNASSEAQLNKKENSMLLKDRMQFKTHGFVISAHQPDKPFRFKISDTVISFEGLAKNRNQIKSTDLEVDTGGVNGYEILAMATPLQSTSGLTIVQTECNRKSDKCTTRLASPWTDDGVYGWGYQVLGSDNMDIFKNKEYFRPLDLENFVLIAQKSTAMERRVSDLKFKINVAGDITDTQYVSNIKILALPK